MMKKVSCLITILTFSFINLFGQHAHVHVVDESFQVEIDQLEVFNQLNALFKAKNSKSYQQISLPISETEKQDFIVRPRYVMSDEFMAEHPEINVFRIKPSKNSITEGVLTVSPYGVYGFVPTDKGQMALYPDVEQNSKVHIIEYGDGKNQIPSKMCDASHHKDEYVPTIDPELAKGPTGSFGNMVKTYRFAAVCSYEFFTKNGSNVGQARTVALNSIAGIEVMYEKDFGENFNALTPFVYTDPNDDLDPGGNRTGQAQASVEKHFPNVNSYDIGHALSTGGEGGVARLGAVCQDGGKASGWSASFNNTSNGWLQLFAHEIGHMHNAPHTFNGIGGSCSGNISSSTSYEIASGTTIMSYQGICQGDNNIPASGAADNYFHANSVDRVTAWINRANDCASETDIGNTPPQVNADRCGAITTIPRLTPFTLFGEADDAENDNLTYSWEQYNEDGPGTNTQGALGNTAAGLAAAPLFRGYPPTGSPDRTFPKMSDVLSGNSSPFEVLSRVARQMIFRLIVRDNHPNGGGIGWDEISVAVGTKGPMAVSFPNGGETVSVGNFQPFTWTTGGSEEYCDSVEILLSLDGGNSFNVVLADKVPYADGEALIQIPNGVSNTDFGRVMIRCNDNECVKFFDVSNENFVLNSNCKAESTAICPSGPRVINSGDFELELDLSKLLGNEITNAEVSVDATSPSMVTTRLDDFDRCVTAGSNNYEAIFFSVSDAGDYFFTLDANSVDSIAFVGAIFEAATFDPSSPCNSFVTANTTVANGGGFSINGILSATLDPCTDYVLTLSRNGNRSAIGKVTNIDGPGSVLVDLSSAPPDDVEYTYLAIDADTDTIIMVRPDSDFKLLEAGSYEIIGVSYLNDGSPLTANPSGWVGLTIADLFQTGECLSLSNNNMPLEVLSSCAVDSVQVMMQSPCDSDRNTYTQELILFMDRSPMTGDVIVNGQAFPIIPDPDGMSPFTMPVLLTDLDSDGKSLDLFITFSEDETCFRTFPNVFDAPINCCDIVIDLGRVGMGPEEVIEVCEGTEVILFAGDQGVGYSWSVNGVPDEDNFTDSYDADVTGQYVVEVTNQFGCSKLDTVVVKQTAFPNLQIVTDEGVICEGTSLLIQASNSARDSTFWYQDGVLIHEDQSTISVTEEAEYVIVAFSEVGCESRDTIETSFVPGVPEPFPSGIVQKCFGDTDTLSAVVDADSTYTYQWSIQPDASDELFIDFGSDKVSGFVVVDQGIWRVTVTSENGCTNTAFRNLSFSPRPVMDQIVPEALEFCFGEDNTLEALASQNAFTFEWFFDGDVVDTTYDNELIVTEGGFYEVVAWTGLECESDTVGITVDHWDLPVLSTAIDTFYPCEGDQVLLEVTDDGPYTYSWTQNSNPLMGETSSTLDASSYGDGTFEMTATTVEGCISTISFEVFTILSPSVEIITAPTDLCDGTEGQIFVRTNLLDVEWELNDTPIVDPNVFVSPNGSVTDHILFITEGGTYKIIGINNQGCEIVETHTVNLLNAPIVEMGPPIIACDPTDLFIVLMTNEQPGDNFQYQWRRDGNLAHSPFVNDLTELEVTMSGEYTVRVTAPAGGCVATDTVQVTISGNPELNFDVEKTALCEGESVTITALTSITDITWYKDGVEIMGETELELVVTDEGNYSAVVMVDASCTATEDVDITVDPIPVVTEPTIAPVCQGTVVTIDLMPEDTYDYVWEVNGIEDPTITTGVFDIPADTPSGSYLYSYVASSGPCETAGEFTIGILDAVVLTIDATLTEFCTGDESTMTVTTNDPTINTIVWTKDGDILADVTGLEYTTTEGGIYTVAFDTGGQCSGFAEIELSAFDSPEITADPDYSACEGQNINIDLMPAGMYTYEWYVDDVVDLSLNGGNITISPTAGDYVYKVIATVGTCSKELIMNVSVISTPTMMIDAPSTSLCTGQDMILTANTNLTTVEWSKDGAVINGETSTTLTINTGGIYTATVSGGTNCDATDQVTIDELPAPMISGMPSVSSCEGLPLELAVIGDMGYDYEWTVDGAVDMSSTGPNITLNLTDGNYVVIATASAGTCADSHTFEVEIIDAPELTLSAPFTSLCTGDEVILTAMSNLSPIEWSKDGTVIQGETGTTLTVNEAGNYVATASAGGTCDATDNIDITVESAPVITADPSYSACEGDDLVIDLMPGGTYDYEWTISGALDPTLTEGVITITPLAGNYTYAVTASLPNCSTELSFPVEIISTPTMSLDATLLSICEGEESTITATTNLSTVEWQLDGVVIPNETGKLLTVTQGGTYTATVSGGVNCSAVDMITIEEFTTPMLDGPMNAGGCEGQPIDIVFTTGGNYTYSWTVDGTVDPSLTTASITIMPDVGNYVYELTAAAGNCVDVATVNVAVIQSPTVTLNAPMTSICSGDEITLTATSNLNNFIWMKDNVEIPGETSGTLTVTEGGDYTVSVSGGNNCDASDMVTIAESSAPVIQMDDQYTSCEGVPLPITVDANGSYTYEWSINDVVDPSLTTAMITVDQPQGIYTYTVVANDNGCSSTLSTTVEFFTSPMISLNSSAMEFCVVDGATLTANSNISNISWELEGVTIPNQNGMTLDIFEGGTYTAIADGGNNCSAEASVTVSGFEDPDISADVTSIQGCEGEDPVLEATVNGNYTLSWDKDGTTLPGETSNTLLVTTSGTYTLTAEGMGNCTSTLEYTVFLQPSEPVTIDEDMVDACVGDSYTITTMSLAPSLTWYKDQVVIPGETGPTLTVTETGIYAAETESANGCKFTDEITVNFNGIPPVDIGPDSDSFCAGTPYQLMVDPSLGSIEWFLDGVLISSDPTIDVTEAGTYTVEVTNSANCVGEDEIVINIDSNLNFDLGPDRGECAGTDVTLEGPASANSYEWTLNGTVISTDQSIQVTQTGLYALEATTDSGCSGNDEVNIVINPEPTGSVPNAMLCPGQTSDLTTNVPFESYLWSNGQNTAFGTYSNTNSSSPDAVTTTESVFVTDINGCSTTIFFNVTSLPALNVDVPQSYFEICPGESVDLIVSGGDTYVWSGPDLANPSIANQTVSPTETSLYQVAISNGNCPFDVFVADIEVFVHEEKVTGIVMGEDSCAFNGIDFELTGFGGFRYEWGPEEFIPGSNKGDVIEVNIEEQTTFTVTITDTNRCEYEHSIDLCVITDADDILEPITIFSPNGDGMNDFLEIEGLEEFPDNQITVFNRWGNIIYEATGYQQNGKLWDGKRDGVALPADTYYYVLRFGGFEIKQAITIVND